MYKERHSTGIYTRSSGGWKLLEIPLNLYADSIEKLRAFEGFPWAQRDGNI
jgi:hypothetical protein